jgi:hypothetical protein
MVCPHSGHFKVVHLTPALCGIFVPHLAQMHEPPIPNEPPLFRPRPLPEPKPRPCPMFIPLPEIFIFVNFILNNKKMEQL